MSGPASVKVSVGSGGGAGRPMWRRVVGANGPELVLDPPNWRYENPETGEDIGDNDFLRGVVEPNREYFVKIIGVTDPFEETSTFGGKQMTSMKFIFEFMICNSRRWSGAHFIGYYRIPKDWADPRGVLPELAFALEGRRLDEDEAFDVARHLRDETQFKAWIVTGVGKESGKSFNKIERHSPIGSADDDDLIVPAGPATVAATAAPKYDTQRNDSASGDDELDDIPF